MILRALHASDGSEIWRKDEGDMQSYSFFPSIQADEQAVYVMKTEISVQPQARVDRWTLFALHAQDGSLLWSNKTQSADTLPPYSVFLPGRYAQVLYLFGRGPGYASIISAFRPQDGKLLWTMKTRFSLQVFVPPDHLYGQTQNEGESFCALHINDGTEAWCSRTNYYQGGIAVGQEAVYLVVYTPYGSKKPLSKPLSEQIYVLSQSHGSLLSHYAVEKDPSRVIITSIALAQ
jgi:outer membrane protein assembly factor BamB